MNSAGPVGLDPRDYRDLVRRALEEDAGRGDITTRAAIDAQARGRGVFVMKSAGVVAGLDVAIEAFRQLDPQVKVTVLRQDADGARRSIRFRDHRARPGCRSNARR